jgi:hypothetical protein
VNGRAGDEASEARHPRSRIEDNAIRSTEERSKDVRRSGLSVVKRSFPGSYSVIESHVKRKPRRVCRRSARIFERANTGGAKAPTRTRNQRGAGARIREGGWQTSVERIARRVPERSRKTNFGSRASSEKSPIRTGRDGGRRLGEKVRELENELSQGVRSRARSQAEVCEWHVARVTVRDARHDERRSGSHERRLFTGLAHRQSWLRR